MSTRHASSPSWRSLDTYRPLQNADLAVWAWEFGRRNLGRSKASAPIKDASDPADVEFDSEPDPAAIPGLCFVGRGPQRDPLPAVIWHWQVDTSTPVLSAVPATCDDERSFDLQKLQLPALMVEQADGVKHVLIVDGRRALRLAVLDGDLLSGPVCFQYRLPAPAAASANLDNLRGLVALRQSGRLPKARRTPPKAGRWIQTVRAFDARSAGVSQREIARLLFGEDRVRQDWNGPSDYMRVRVQHLIRRANALIAGGYRALLGASGGAPPPRPVTAVWKSTHWLASYLAVAMVASGCSRAPQGDALAPTPQMLDAGAECLPISPVFPIGVEAKGIDPDRARRSARANAGVLLVQPQGPSADRHRFAIVDTRAITPGKDAFIGGSTLGIGRAMSSGSTRSSRLRRQKR
jgi:hypothetical protein